MIVFILLVILICAAGFYCVFVLFKAVKEEDAEWDRRHKLIVELHEQRQKELTDEIMISIIRLHPHIIGGVLIRL